MNAVRWIASASRAAALILTLIGSLRIAGTYRVLSNTVDEGAHLAAGMQWLDQHLYDLEDQHPPLARVVGALIPYLAGVRSQHDSNVWYEGFKILGRDEHYDRVLALGRSGILVFFWLGSATIFWWADLLGGPVAAIMATAFFTTTPAVLAHSGLITTDMGLAALTAATALASISWAKQPSVGRTIILGIVLGCAVLSKFSAIAFVPSAWLAMYGWRVYCDRPGIRTLRGEIRARLLPACGALVAAMFVIWAGYRFTVGPVEFLGGYSLPAPHFYSGIREVWIHNREGHGSYLLGKLSHDGFFYYYPVVVGVKTPLAMVILVLGVAGLSIGGRCRDLGMPLAFAFGILLFASSSHINIGVRHVLPVYSGFAVACGAGLQRAISSRDRWRIPAGIATGALLAWQVLSGWSAHPDYLAYTNEFGGSQPESVLVDSDLDWGQDMNRLSDFFATVKTNQIYTSVLNSSYSDLIGHKLPRILPANDDHPQPGWNVISVTPLKLNGNPKWAQQIPPLRRIGRSTYIWFIP